MLLRWSRSPRGAALLFVGACFLAVPQARAALDDEAPAGNPAADTADAVHDESATPDGPLPGHSSHGEAFDEGPRQAAYLMQGTGDVHFPVTTSSPDAQKFFDQGVGQLHGFWYLEAERSFRQAAALDPQLAMAYWGMAMANVNNEKRAAELIAEAVERKDAASPREALWIDSLAQFYTEEAKKDDKARRRKLVDALENIIHEHPDDLEAKAFLAVTLWQNSSKGISIESHQSVDSLLDQVFAENAAHPAHHYRIHLWDKKKPQRALASAAECGRAGPGIAHMWHMPGHIYSGLRRYDDACWQQEASARVDHAHMMRDRVMPDEIHNFAHNNEWLIRNLIKVGRVRDAVDLAKNMISLPQHPKYNTLDKSGSAKYGRERLFDVLARYELWDELAELCGAVYLAPTDKRNEQIKRLRLLGRANYGRGALETAREQTGALEALLAEAKTAQQTAGDEAEKKARDEGQSDEDVAKARKTAEDAHRGDIGPLEKALAEMAAGEALAAGNAAEALKKLDEAGDIDRETRSRVALAAGDANQAEKLARDAVKRARNEVYPLANAVDVLFRAGKTKEAKEMFERLRKRSASIDLDAPVFARLTPVVEELGLPDDWRVAAETASDVGNRPSLDSLGPFRWQPSPAPDWSLVDGDGQPVSLADYRGKPVLVVFYLGFGCVHCAEQIQALVPLHEKFQQAGVSLVAISTESPEELQTGLAAWAVDKPDAPIPFPLLADDGHGAFKSYRAYDDFEQLPLHGAFLIDAAGLVRWQDIGPEPFMQLDFLLEESKRLLAQ